MKKAGIVIDAYKLDKFKERLTNAGYLFEISKLPSILGLLISVEFNDGEEKKITRICQELELHFNHSN